MHKRKCRNCRGKWTVYKVKIFIFFSAACQSPQWNMTGLVMDPLELELEPWIWLHFILLCLGMLQTKFYHSRLKSMVLAAKIRDKLSLHLPGAQSQFYKNLKLCHNQAKTGAIELWMATALPRLPSNNVKIFHL